MIELLIFELETDVFDNILHKPLKFIYEFPQKTLGGVRHEELSRKSFSNTDTDKSTKGIWTVKLNTHRGMANSAINWKITLKNHNRPPRQEKKKKGKKIGLSYAHSPSVQTVPFQCYSP